MTQFAGGQAATHSGSTSGSSPNPTQDQCGGGAGSSQLDPASSATAAPMNQVPGSSSSSHEKAASRAELDGYPQEQPSRAPGPKSSRKGVSRRVGPSPGRRVWACAECGVTAHMLDSGKFRECTGCGTVRYCGKACQKAHWPAHKPACKRLQPSRQEWSLGPPAPLQEGYVVLECHTLIEQEQPR
jgi:hypothetical protein